jgi:hypothetical protein
LGRKGYFPRWQTTRYPFERTRLARAPRYLCAMLLRPEYLSQNLDRPLPTKDGGTLHTIRVGT